MSVIQVKPPMLSELKKYGAKDVSACINCGNCTAICSLIDNYGGSFPRKTIRDLQLGQKEKILSSTEPWLCYYCGDCSATCPKGANPGEIMMGVRRYLTAEYDITGQGRRLYTSSKARWTAIIGWFFIPIIFLGILHGLGKASVVTSEVKLNEFAPVEIINISAHVYAIYLSFILLTGAFRMWNKVMNNGAVPVKVKLSDYVKELKNAAYGTLTINRWISGGKNKRRWILHYYLAASYIIMFTIIVGFLKWFQTDEIYPLSNPQRWVGYIITFGLLLGTTEILIGRMRKKEEIHKHSHHTDWLFPISVMLVALSGILVHILRYGGYPWPTYIMYALHLGITAVMLSTEVGVGKWTHIFYRPLGLYLDGVKKRALVRSEQITGGEET